MKFLGICNVEVDNGMLKPCTAENTAKPSSTVLAIWLRDLRTDDLVNGAGGL